MNFTLEEQDIHNAIGASCDEIIEPKNMADDRMSLERPNCRVRFQPARCTKIVHPDETSQILVERKHLVWYQPSDIQHFQFNDETLIRKYRSIVRSNQRLGRNNLEDVESEKKIEDEMRGLEDNFSILSQLRHQRRLADARGGVLTEQERQRDLWAKGVNASQSFVLDVEMLRNVYASSSMKSKLIAYSLGQSDAAIARKFQNESPISCRVLRSNRNIGNIQEEMKSTLRKDRNHTSPTFNKKTECTASSILRQQQIRHIHALHAVGSTRVSI